MNAVNAVLALDELVREEQCATKEAEADLQMSALDSLAAKKISQLKQDLSAAR